MIYISACGTALDSPKGDGASEGEKTMTFLATLLRAYRRWRTYNRTYAELAQLDDRTLNDLNLRRSEIDFVARDAAHQVI